jgi:hypothetical protein
MCLGVSCAGGPDGDPRDTGDRRLRADAGDLRGAQERERPLRFLQLGQALHAGAGEARKARGARWFATAEAGQTPRAGCECLGTA